MFVARHPGSRHPMVLANQAALDDPTLPRGVDSSEAYLIFIWRRLGYTDDDIAAWKRHCKGQYGATIREDLECVTRMTGEFELATDEAIASYDKEKA